MMEFLEMMFDPLQDLFGQLRAFLPGLLAMLVILVVGIVLATLLRLILVKFLTAVKFDGWSDRMGFTKLMRKGDLWSKPSAIAGSVATTTGIVTGRKSNGFFLQMPEPGDGNAATSDGLFVFTGAGSPLSARAVSRASARRSRCATCTRPTTGACVRSRRRRARTSA